jgi:hypothetical protein
VITYDCIFHTVTLKAKALAYRTLLHDDGAISAETCWRICDN